MAGLFEAVIFIWLFIHCVCAQRMLYISGTEPGKNNTCGGSFTLAPRASENVTLTVSNGRLPKGFCEVTVGINNSQRCKRQICVQAEGTLTNSGLNFKFTPNPGQSTTEYRGPYTELENGKCFDAYSVFLNISEPVGVGHNFDFQLFFTPTCNDSNSKSLIDSSDADSRTLDTKEDLERAWLLTTVYGAVTGVCLAIFFLIVLFITYCYYRSYPYGNKKREHAPKKQAPAPSSDKKEHNKQRDMEEMKLLEQAEPAADSSGLVVSDGDVVDLEEGTSSKTGGEPDNQAADSLKVEKETSDGENVEKGEGDEEKKGNDFVDVDLKTPDADTSQKAALLDSD